MNQRLKHLRVTHALSQSHIADCLGISQSAYSQIEKGSVSISVEHLKILSKKFNVSLDWLIWGKGPRVSSYQAKELIPLVSIASQGAYAKNTGNDKFTTSLPHCKIPGFTDPRHQVFEVPEEDLAPHLFTGDFVVCSRVQGKSVIQIGAILVVVSEGGVSLRFATVDDKTAANQKAPQPLELWQVRSKISSVLTISNEHQEQRITNLEREFSQVKRQLIRTLHKFRLQEEEKPS